jgi:ankyrin repeat protein
MNDVIRAVIRKGGDVNLASANKSAPLHLAVKEKHSWTAKVLCEVGADVNARDAAGMTPFSMALQQTILLDQTKSVELVRTLIPYCKNLNVGDSEGCTPLHYISATFPPSVSQSELLTLLIASGVDVNKANNQGRTALHLAAAGGNTSVLRALIDAGAELNVTDKLLGETPLNMAAAYNHIDAIRVLAEYGADICIADRHLMTPLHKILASRGCQYESTDLLLSYGARVNAEDDRGVSPLMWCVLRSVKGQLRDDGVGAMRRLVAAGAHLHPDLNRCSIQHSPLSLLTWQGHLPAAAFLVNAGWDLRGEVWPILPGKNPALEQFLAKLRTLVAEPWSLQALCRREIRRRLNEAGKDRDIVPMVERLNMPRAVKGFLCFELEGDEI